MYIDGKYIDESDVVGQNTSFLKKYNNIYITEDQVSILNRYDININNYNDIKSLIYDIEDILNTSIESLEDLEWVSESLSEYNYYNNTNK